MTKVQELLRSAFSKLMSKVAPNGVIAKEYVKDDDTGLGLDTGNEIDFDKVLHSSAMQDIITEYAENIASLGTLTDSDIRGLVGSFVSSIAEYISTTHADLVDEAVFETKAKEDFASMILQATKEKQNGTSGTDGDGATSGEDNKMAQQINTNVVNITTQMGSGNAFNFNIDAQGATLTHNQIINAVVLAISETKIDINQILAAMVNTDIEFRFMVDGNPIDIKDAKAIITAHIKTIITKRTDILNVFIDAMFKDIKVDVTEDIVALIDKISVKVGIDKNLLIKLIEEKKDIKIEYDMTGKLTVRKAIATTVKSADLVAKYCEYLGIKDGKIGTKIDLTADVIKAIEKVTIECGVNVSELIAALTKSVKTDITFVRDGKVVSLADVTTDIYVALHDKALIQAVDTVTTMLTDIHDTLSADEIVSRLQDITAFYKVDIDDVVNMILARTDIQITYEDKGKVITGDLASIIKGKVKAGLENKAESGVISELKTILDGANFDGKLTSKNIENILNELEGISAKYKVPVAELINKLVEGAIVENTYVDETGKALTLEEVKTLIMKGLDKVALGKAQDDIKELIEKISSTDGKVDVLDLLNGLDPIARNYNVSVDDLVTMLVADATVTVTYTDNGEPVGDIQAVLRDKVKAGLDKRAENAIISELQQLVANFSKEGKIKDYSVLLSELQEIAVEYRIDADKLADLLQQKFNITINEKDIEQLNTALDEILNNKALEVLLEKLGVVDGKLTKPNATVKTSEILKYITEVSAEFGFNPQELLDALNDKLVVKIKEEDLEKLRTALEATSRDIALTTIANELNQGITAELSTEEIADKIDAIAVKFNIKNPLELVELLEKQGKLKVTVNFDELKQVILKRVAVMGEEEVVRGISTIDGMEIELDTAALDRIIANAGKSTVRVKLTKEQMRYVVAGLIKASKLTAELDEKTLEELKKLGIEGIKDNISITDLNGILGSIQTEGGITNIQQNNMFNFMMGMYAGAGYINSAAPVCRPCMMQQQVMPYPVYMPVPMPVMQGGYPGVMPMPYPVPGGNQGIVGGNTVVMPPYWPWQPPQQNNNDEILKAIKELNDNISKKLDELTRGGSTGGGTPTPPPAEKEKYTPTEEEVKAAIAARLGSFEKLADLDLDARVKLTVDVHKLIQANHPDKIVVGVDGIISMLYAALKKKPEKEDDIPEEEDEDTDTHDDDKEDDMDFSKDPIEPKRSRWQRFKAWCGRHKGVLIGIPLIAAAGALGVGFGAAAIVGTGVTEGLGAVVAHGIANSALGQFVTWNGPIAATIAGALGVGGVASTVVGAIPMGKKASIAHSYNGVLKARNKVRAANARSRELITRQLGFDYLLRQTRADMATYSTSPKDLERLNKQVKKLQRKLNSNSKKMAKASVKETDRLVEEVKKIARLNRKEKKHDHRVSGSKSINKKGYTQKYIDLLTKRRAGQITQEEFETQLAAIPEQYRNTKYTTFATELQMDLTENRQTTAASQAIRAGKKPDPSAGFVDFEEDKEL